MPNSRLIKKIFIVFFMCCIIFPNILSLLGIQFHSDENRNLKERPEFTIQNINHYPSEYTAYYEDNMPFKDILVKCNSFLHIDLFGISSEKAVILGKEGWLFYNSQYKEETDTLEDYINSEMISTEELEHCKNNLLKMKEICENEGIPFVFMIVPNKMTIYGEEFMPDTYERESEVTKVDILVKYLKDNTDLNIVYPKDDLLKNKNNQNLYYKLDSHWNSLGSYIGYRKLYETIFQNEIAPLDNSMYTTQKIEHGDLSLLLKYDQFHDTQYNVSYKADITFTLEGEYNNFYTISNNKQDIKLLMFRDSFTQAMEQYLVKDFSEAHFVWSYFFDKELVQEESPDIVVYEIAERYVFDIPDVQ